MKRLAVLATFILALFATSAFALDPIWDMHYTFGPESRKSPKFGAGVGLRSDFGDQVLFPANILGCISKDFEIGAKIDINTYNKMDNSQLSLDIGGKYHLQPGRFIELDGYFGLNRNNGSAVILTYGMEHFIAKNFSNFYEARAGFLDGVTGEDGYVKFAFGMTPTLNFGHTVRVMIEINTSESIGHMSDDFMIDIIPKLEVALGAARVRLDFDIGVMQEKNNDQKTIALYVMTAL